MFQLTAGSQINDHRFLMAQSYAGFVVMFAWLSNSFPRPPSKRAVAFALINAFSQLGNVAGSWVQAVDWLTIAFYLLIHLVDTYGQRGGDLLIVTLTVFVLPQVERRSSCAGSFDGTYNVWTDGWKKKEKTGSDTCCRWESCANFHEKQNLRFAITQGHNAFIL